MVPTSMASGSRRQVGGRQRYTRVCILSETHTVPRREERAAVCNAPGGGYGLVGEGAAASTPPATGYDQRRRDPLPQIVTALNP